MSVCGMVRKLNNCDVVMFSMSMSDVPVNDESGQFRVHVEHLHFNTLHRRPPFYNFYSRLFVLHHAQSTPHLHSVRDTNYTRHHESVRTRCFGSYCVPKSQKKNCIAPSVQRHFHVGRLYITPANIILMPSQCTFLISASHQQRTVPDQPTSRRTTSAVTTPRSYTPACGFLLPHIIAHMFKT